MSAIATIAASAASAAELAHTARASLTRAEGLLAAPFTHPRKALVLAALLEAQADMASAILAAWTAPPVADPLPPRDTPPRAYDPAAEETRVPDAPGCADGLIAETAADGSQRLFRPDPRDTVAWGDGVTLVRP